MSKTFRRGNIEFNFKRSKSPEPKKKGRDPFKKMVRELVRNPKHVDKMLEEV